MKYLAYAFLALFLATGCVRNSYRIRVPSPAPAPVENNNAVGHGSLYNTDSPSSFHKLKPEPYSLGSKKKDPELMGAESTTRAHVQNVNMDHKVSTNAIAMNKSECISMVGQTKFDIYSKRFGGESGAIRRCTILKRLGQ